jgi:hypothetical protein
MRFSKYVTPLVAVLALVGASGASAFVVSHASSRVVQSQPPPSSCRVKSSYPFNMPDPYCTPGALNPAVTQATIRRTICRPGYSSSIRPSSSVTGREKLASMRAYGMRQGPGAYEYDHLISLELGGAANDSRNLWPENGASPNLKDNVENRLHTLVCNGSMTLARAQQIIAYGWVKYYKTVVLPPPPPPAPAPSSNPPGATGQCVDGTYTDAIHHQGACSHHGGVATWF